MEPLFVVVALVVLLRIAYLLGRARAERGRARYDMRRTWHGRSAYRKK